MRTSASIKYLCPSSGTRQLLLFCHIVPYTIHRRWLHGQRLGSLHVVNDLSVQGRHYGRGEPTANFTQSFCNIIYFLRPSFRFATKNETAVYSLLCFTQFFKTKRESLRANVEGACGVSNRFISPIGHMGGPNT